MYKIIGGSGFIGSRLQLEIFDYVVLDKCLNGTQFLDITKPDTLYNKIHSNDFIILLAAEHKDNVSPISNYYETNVQGTRNVLNEMDRAGCKNLIFTSSVAVYGLNKDNPSENDSTDPFNHYGKSKLQAEKVIQEWYDKSPLGKSVTIIRPTVIFGERNRGNIYNLLNQIITGHFLMIGNGNNKKSMAYIDNVVAFIKYRLEKAEFGYHIFNYSDKPDFSMTELISFIENKMNLNIPKYKLPFWIGMLGGYLFDIFAFLTQKKLQLSSIRIKKFCANTVFDASKAHSDFKSPYTLEEGLIKTLESEFINSK